MHCVGEGDAWLMLGCTWIKGLLLSCWECPGLQLAVKIHNLRDVVARTLNLVWEILVGQGLAVHNRRGGKTPVAELLQWPSKHSHHESVVQHTAKSEYISNIIPLWSDLISRTLQCMLRQTLTVRLTMPTLVPNAMCWWHQWPSELQCSWVQHPCDWDEHKPIQTMCISQCLHYSYNIDTILYVPVFEHVMSTVTQTHV